MSAHTIRLHCVLLRKKVYRAFLDADAMGRWLSPFGGNYIEFLPNELLRYTDKFDDPNLPGLIEVTVTLKKGCAAPR